MTLNVSGNSESSSVLQMLDRHVRGAPASRYVQTEQVPLRRLDSFRETLALTTEPSLLKLDVQGYEEDQVLEGATKTLEAVNAIECELSLASLYQGQPSLTAMVEMLREHSFVLVAVQPVYPLTRAQGNCCSSTACSFVAEPRVSFAASHQGAPTRSLGSKGSR